MKQTILTSNLNVSLIIRAFRNKTNHFVKALKCLTLVMLLIIPFNSFAQTDDAYAEGNKIFQAGITFGYYGYGYVGSRSGVTIPLTASLEYGINDYLSVGPYVGFASWGYTGYNNYKYSWTYISFGGRGSFHYVPLLNEVFETDLDESKYDFYITVLLGAELRHYKSNDVYYDNFYGNSTKIIFGPVAGFKYYFSNAFGVYFEGGRGAFGYGTLGVSLKF